MRIRDARLGDGRGFADPRLMLAGLIAYALLSRVLIAIVVPAWQGPDEPKHFEYVRTLVDKRAELWAERRLLTLDDGIPELQQHIIDSMARYHFWELLSRPVPSPLPTNFKEAFGDSWTQLHRPSLYYDLGGLVMLSLQGASIETQNTAMRVLSAALSSLPVLPAYAIGRLVASRDSFVPIACAAVVAMLPMAVFIGGTTNNDNLLVLFGVLAVLGMTRGVVRGFTWRTWLLILGSIALGLLTKRGAAILLPGVAVCGCVWLAQIPARTRRWALAGIASASALLGLGIATGWLARVLPVERGVSTLTEYALNSRSQWDNLLAVPLASEHTRQIVGVELEAYFNSFWGMFGWFTVPLAPGVYMGLLIVTGVCGLGCIGWLLGIGSDSGTHRLALATLFATLVVSAIVAGLAERLAYYSVNEVPQGRYLFVVLGAIAALYAVGLRTWLPPSRVGTRLPTLGCVGALLALDVYAFLGAIVPYFSM